MEGFFLDSMGSDMDIWRRKVASQLLDVLEISGGGFSVDEFVQLLQSCTADDLNLATDYTMDLEYSIWHMGHLESCSIASEPQTPGIIVQLIEELLKNGNGDQRFTHTTLAIMYQLSKISLLSKINMYSEPLLDSLIDALDNNTKDTWIEKMIQNMILQMTDFGFSPYQLHKLYDHCLKNDKHASIFYNIFDNYSNTMQNNYIFYDDNQVSRFNNLKLVNTKTGVLVSAWIKLTRSTDSLSPLSDMGSFKFLTLETANGSLMIQYCIENGRIQLVTPTEEQWFVCFQLELDKVYNISFAHICEGKQKMRVDVYINGIHMESKIINTLFNDPNQTTRSIFSYNKANTLRSLTLNLIITGPSKIDNLVMETNSCYIIETSNYQQWILFINFLGQSYSGSFDDNNLLSLINSSKYFDMYLAFNSILSNFEENLSLLKFPKFEVILAWNKNHNTGISENSFFKKGYSLVDGLDSIGGIISLLNLIEQSNTKELVLKNVNLLFKILQHNKMLESSFVSSSGYEILAILLKLKKDLITIEILESVLSYSGYNLTLPGDSIIRNRMAYKSLILDFGIWNCDPNPANKEINQFLLFQFTVFAQESKFYQFNIQQISKMKIIKKILLALKKNTVDEKILKEENNILWIIIKHNHSPEVIKLLVLHIIYAVNKTNNNDNRDMGVQTILIILKRLVKIQPKILKSFNVNFLLSVMKGNLAIRKLGLDLIIKYTSVAGNKAYLTFLNYGGFSVLTSYLKQDWYDDEIFTTLFMGVFPLFVDNNKDQNKSITELLKQITNKTEIQTPHFFAVLNNLMKIAAYNLKSRQHGTAIKTLDNYYQLLMLLKNKSEFDKRFDHAFMKNEECMGNLLFLVLIIKQKDTELFSKYSTFLREILIDRLYADENDSKSNFLEHIYADYQVEFNSIVIPLLFKKLTDFQSLISLLFLNVNKANTICKIFVFYLQSYFDFQLFNNSVFLENFNVVSLVIERLITASKSQPKIIPLTNTLIKEFVESLLIVSFYCINNNEDLPPENLRENIKKCCETFMSNPNIIVKACNSYNLMSFFILFFKILSSDLHLQSLASNCLRVLIRLSSLDTIFEGVDLQVLEKLVKLTDDVFTTDDDNVLELFQNDVTIENFCDKTYSDHYDQISKNKIFKSDRRTVDTYIDNRFQFTKSKKILETEIDPFNKIIFNGELKNHNCHIQDEIDDYYHYINLFKTYKANLLNSKIPYTSVLYPAEGRDRKRNKVVKIIGKEDEICEYSEILKPSLSIEEIDQDLNSFNIITTIDADFDEDKNRRILRNLFVDDQITAVFNVTQIIGLDTIESILVLGVEHLYIVEGYFYSPEGEILCDYEAPNDQRDDFVKLLNGSSIGNYKEADNLDHKVKFRMHQSKNWSLRSLVSVSKRKFLLRDVGFELFFNNGTSALLTCINKNKRNAIFNKLNSSITSKLDDKCLEEALKLASQQKIRKSYDSFNNETSAFSIVDSLLLTMSDISSSDITSKWCNGDISNFQYLMMLNTIAGRTFNDLTQYQVFPFVLSNYQSEKIDLSDESNYRDLSKPMGAQSRERETQFKERYEATKEMSTDTPPFHYGTHYSSAMIVSSYMIRVHPFTESYLKLQGGKFDHSDRLFYSIPKLWNSASKDNTIDVRELIPEFYYLPNFLKNFNSLEFGQLQDGKDVNDVELPPWSNNNPVKFINIMRDALESEYVSQKLNEWIDLIFGYKQQGIEAINATNVFHYLSYPGGIDLEKIVDKHEKAVITSIIHNFGQTPLQIFRKKHPQKNNYKFKSVLDKFKTGFMNKIDQRIEYDYELSELIYDQEICKWVGIPDKVSLLPGKDKYLTKVETINGNSIKVNDIYIFEELSINGEITLVKIISINKILIGFSNGMMKVFEFTNNKMKYLTNAQRSMVRLEYECRKRKKLRLFETSRKNSINKLSNNGSNNDNEWILLEIGNLRDGHFSKIVDVKYFKYDRIISSIDSKLEKIVIWQEPEKFKFENFEIFHMCELELGTYGDDKILDFDIFEDGNYIFGLTMLGAFKVWKIGMGLVYENKIEIDNLDVNGSIGLNKSTKIRVCLNFIDNDYMDGWIFMIYSDGLGISIYYLSKSFEKFEKIGEVDNLVGKKITDFKLFRCGDEEFKVVLGVNNEVYYFK